MRWPRPRTGVDLVSVWAVGSTSLSAAPAAAICYDEVEATPGLQLGGKRTAWRLQWLCRIVSKCLGEQCFTC